jgi:hypothetical protein
MRIITQDPLCMRNDIVGFAGQLQWCSFVRRNNSRTSGWIFMKSDVDDSRMAGWSFKKYEMSVMPHEANPKSCWYF